MSTPLTAQNTNATQRGNQEYQQELFSENGQSLATRSLEPLSSEGVTLRSTSEDKVIPSEATVRAKDRRVHDPFHGVGQPTKTQKAGNGFSQQQQQHPSKQKRAELHRNRINTGSDPEATTIQKIKREIPEGRPNHINERHWHELTVDSAISSAIATANFATLSGKPVLERLAGDKLNELGGHAGQYATAPVKRILERYSSVAESGWWCTGGVDPLNHWEPMEWGCFKPINPREGWTRNDSGQWEKTGKRIKYEHPAGVPTRLFILDGPLEPTPWTNIKYDKIPWERIAEDKKIPLIIAEGAKKTACLLSNGFIAVGIPGITQWNVPTTRNLIPELRAFAIPEREIYIVLDEDTEENKRRAVERETQKLGDALKHHKCKVKVIEWNSALGKGVDDLIADYGVGLFREAFLGAIDFEPWALRQQSKLSYTPNWVAPEGQKYLEPDGQAIPIPNNAKLVGLKAPKGTGKTEAIKRLVDEASQSGQRVLFISHRVQLTQALCDRVGVVSIYEVLNARKGQREQVRADVAANGMGLCCASLHPIWTSGGI